MSTFVNIYSVFRVTNYNSAAHVHFQDGKHLTGTIQQHKCTAEIIIFLHTDSSVRKAVVVTAVGCPHNHLPSPLEKQTYEATELYTEAVGQVGIIGATVGQIDRGVGFNSYLYLSLFSFFDSQL